MVGRIENHALTPAKQEDRCADVLDAGLSSDVDIEDARQFGVPHDAKRGRAQAKAKCQHDPSARLLLEGTAAIAESAVRGSERDPLAGRAVENVDLRDHLRYVLAVRADVLDRRGTAPPGDARQCLDARPSLADRMGDDLIPWLARHDREEYSAVRLGYRYPTAGDLDDRALESGIGDDQVAAVTEQEDGSGTVVALANRLEDLLVRPGDDPAVRRPADAKGRVIGQGRRGVHGATLGERAATNGG